MTVRRRNSGFWQGLAGCLALAGLLLVLTASYWHAPHGAAVQHTQQVYHADHAHHSHHGHGGHHEHGDAPQETPHPEHSCPVCIAVHTPTSSGLIGDTAGVPAPVLTGTAPIAHDRAAPALPLPVSRARGPPRGA